MMRRFTFGRIHYRGLFEGLFKTSVKQDLLEIQNQRGFIVSDRYHWVIKDIDEEIVDGMRIVKGKIVKIIPRQEIATVDEETKSERIDDVADVKDKESLFLISPEFNLIALETHKTMTSGQLEKMLIAGFLKVGKAYQPEIDYTYDDDRIVERLLEFSAVKSAKFKLTATNPHANNEFKPLDDQFQRSNVHKAEMYYRADDDKKLDIDNPHSIVRQSLMMAAAGYGSGSIFGRNKKDKPYTVSLGDNLIDRVDIKESLTDDEIIKNIVIKFKKKDDCA